MEKSIETEREAALKQALTRYEEAGAAALAETQLFGAARVKRGLIWLGTKEARDLGLSLDLLIEQAVKDRATAEQFDLMLPEKCALGYATVRGGYGTGSTRSRYYQVVDTMGIEWATEHGFQIEGDGGLTVRAGEPAYRVLTEEWRRQLQALAEENDQ